MEPAARGRCTRVRALRAGADAVLGVAERSMCRLTAPGQGTLWQQVALPRLVKAARGGRPVRSGLPGPLVSEGPDGAERARRVVRRPPRVVRLARGTAATRHDEVSARRAARILTFSDFSKQEISRYLGVEHDRIDVIYHGLSPAGIAHGGHRPDLTDSAADGIPVVLYVGSIFNRRHIPELIDGFARLATRMPCAPRTCRREPNDAAPWTSTALIAASPRTAADSVRGPTCRMQSSPALYRRASVFVFLSDYEGFGMTPIEALAAGVPIVVLDTAVTREIYGPAALYIERPDPRLIEPALERLLFDDAERATR